MRNPNFKKKFCVIFIAAILGAVLFDSMILMLNFVGSVGLDLLVSMPTVSISEFLGLKQLANPFVVNGLFGAIAFAVIAIFWQFWKRDKSKNKNSITGI